MQSAVKPVEWETFQVKTASMLSPLSTAVLKNMLQTEGSKQGYQLSSDKLFGFTSKNNTSKTTVNTNQQLRRYLHEHGDRPRFGLEAEQKKPKQGKPRQEDEEHSSDSSDESGYLDMPFLSLSQPLHLLVLVQCLSIVHLRYLHDII